MAREEEEVINGMQEIYHTIKSAKTDYNSKLMSVPEFYRVYCSDLYSENCNLAKALRHSFRTGKKRRPNASTLDKYEIIIARFEEYKKDKNYE